jgi:hypothetical protein
MQILNRLNPSPVNAPNAVKAKKSFQTNLTGRTPAVPARSPSILHSAHWKAKAKASLRADRLGLTIRYKI